MKRSHVVPPLAFFLLIGLPLMGVWLAGLPVSVYLEFPPRTLYVQHAPFSWPVFLILALLVVSSVGPILYRVLISNYQPTTQHSALGTQHCGFPSWGWLGLGWTAIWWVLAWTRFPWMAPLQEHTFTPLWLGYILVVNALTYRRTGHCMLLHRPRYLLSLFPLSAAFWWLFEYLNRFVQNWHYVGVADLSPLEYVLRATIPFSTVLPAVVGTAELLSSSRTITAGLGRYKMMRVERRKRMSAWMFMLSSAGLLAIGLRPNYLFPLVWVGPLLLIISIQSLSGQRTIFSPLARGDWRGLWVPALAALICGLFWELWNWKSLAHWEYAIPFVHGFQLFEMPLLGYAGYLPFGLECVVVADLCLSRRFADGVEYDSRNERR